MAGALSTSGSWQALRRIVRLGRPSGWVAAGVAVLAVLTVAELSMPWIAGRIVDSAVAGGDGRSLVRWCIFLAVAASVSAASRGGYRLIFAWWGAATTRDVRERMLDHLHRIETRVLDREPSGRLTALFGNDASIIGSVFHTLLPSIVLSLLQLIAIVLVLWVEYRSSMWVLAVLVPFYVAFPLLLSKRLRKHSRHLQDAQAEASSRVQEIVQGTREIKVLGQQEWSLRRAGESFAAIVRRYVELVRFQAVGNLEYALYWSLLSVLYWWGGRRVLSGEITIGELVAFVGYLGYVSGPVSRLFDTNNQLQRAFAAGDRLNAFLTQPVEPLGGDRILPPGRGGCSIDLESVTFRYDGRTEPALNDVSFHIDPGERVALVGPSGGGKSTVVKLLLRFHVPQHGRVLLDGCELGSYRLDSLRRAIGVVFQETFLFAGSIRENVLLGNLGATQADLAEAADSANVAEFIARFPAGWDTGVGERGVHLSVGQKQRVAVARVAVGDPRLVILDEATSALDAESETLVQEAMDRLCEGRTSLVIAHRLPTVRTADRILVLDEGRLVAQGTHAELLQVSQLYRRLCELQLADDGRPGAPPSDRSGSEGDR